MNSQDFVFKFQKFINEKLKTKKEVTFDKKITESAENNKVYAVAAIGKDMVGLVGLITSFIAEINGNIIDIEENVLQGYFNIFLLVDLNKSTVSFNEFSNKMKSLASETGLNIIIEKHHKGRERSIKEKILIILLGKDRPGIVSKIAYLLGNYGINIEHIRMLNRGNLFAMEIIGDIKDINIPLNVIKKDIMQNMKAVDINVVFQDKHIFTKQKRLILFNINSDKCMASLFNILQEQTDFENIDIDAYLSDNGNIFEYLTFLKDIDINVLSDFSECIVPAPGSIELIEGLHEMGYKIALISYGIKQLIINFTKILDLDYYYSNEPVVENGILTGKLKEPIITPETKNKILNEIKKIENLTDDDVVTIGKSDVDNFNILNSGLELKLDVANQKLNNIVNDKKFNNQQLLGLFIALKLI